MASVEPEQVSYPFMSVNFAQTKHNSKYLSISISLQVGGKKNSPSAFLYLYQSRMCSIIDTEKFIQHAILLLLQDVIQVHQSWIE